MQQVNNVLLVDDDLMSNIINKKIIQVSKFTNNVAFYLRASEAIVYLKKLLTIKSADFPNVVFVDLNMPEMSGWDFIDELNKLPEFPINKCKIIPMSSTISGESFVKSKSNRQTCDVILKPLTFDKIGMLNANYCGVYNLAI